MESRVPLLEHKPAKRLVSAPAVNPAETADRLPLSEQERRGRVRVPSQLPLTVKFGGIYESAAEATNISARGIFFTLQQRLDAGKSLELVFRLPRHVIGVDGIWLRCAAEVVRVQENLPKGNFGIAAKITGYEIFVG